MPGYLMLGIEPVREATVESVHPQRDIGIGGFDEQVIVVRHQAVGVTAPAVDRDHISERRQEYFAVAPLEKDALAAVSTRCYVVKTACNLGSRRTRHAGVLLTTESVR